MRTQLLVQTKTGVGTYKMEFGEEKKMMGTVALVPCAGYNRQEVTEAVRTGVRVEQVETMRELGVACGIAVGAAVAVLV